MITNCNLAPFINENFYVTGAYGEQRPTHIHKGVDLATGKRSPIYSMSSGVVNRRSYDAGGYGDYLIIKSDDGMGFLYGDLDSEVLVNVFDRVEKGQIIGYAGNPIGTASTGLHVHVEQQDISNHSWNFNFASGFFINPCVIMGIENKVDRVNGYIYTGEISYQSSNWRNLFKNRKTYNIKF